MKGRGKSLPFWQNWLADLCKLWCPTDTREMYQPLTMAPKAVSCQQSCHSNLTVHTTPSGCGPWSPPDVILHAEQVYRKIRVALLPARPWCVFPFASVCKLKHCSSCPFGASRAKLEDEDLELQVRAQIMNFLPSFGEELTYLSLSYSFSKVIIIIMA